MKNFLILGLLALLLFSISAAMSLWLNQSRQQAETANAEKEKEKEKDKDKEKAVAKKGEPKETTEPKTPAKIDTPPTSGSESTAKKLGEREARLEDRAAKIELIMRDIQSQRESNETLMKQVAAELKNVSGETTKLDSLIKDLNKKSIEINSLEDANIGKLAAMYDSISAEAAAPILKEMAEKGRMDMAAKIMVKMKERNSARVLEAMEPALAAQLMERILRLRTATPPTSTPAPTPKQ